MTAHVDSHHSEARPTGLSPTFEMYPDTLLDVEAVKIDIEKLRAGEAVQSQYAVPIAHIEFDITQLDLDPVEFGRYVDFGSVELSPSSDDSETETAMQGYLALPSEHISDKDRQTLATLATTFGRVVMADRDANGLGYSPDMTHGVHVFVKVGNYDGLERGGELHTDGLPDTVKSPRIRYIASFGLGEGTASVETPVTNNSKHPGVTTTTFSNEFRETLTEKQSDTGTVDRFVSARDAHYGPMESGFRIFLDATLSAEPIAVEQNELAQPVNEGENGEPTIDEKHVAGTNAYELSLGNKNLIVKIISKEVPEFMTFVINSDSNTSVPNETTRLYGRAAELMQQVTDRAGKPIRYVFGTSNPSMMNWGRTVGQSIFNWRVVTDEEGFRFVAEKVFTPTQPQ